MCDIIPTVPRQRRWSAGSRKIKRRWWCRSAYPGARRLLEIDTIAVLGTAAALVMLVCMLAGVVRLTITENKIAQAQTSVQVLQEENERLQLVYQDSYDLKAVESAAVSMGMIPREQAQHMQIRLPQPEQQERSVWEQWIDQLKELFA